MEGGTSSVKYLVKFTGKLVEEEWDQAATLLRLRTGAQHRSFLELQTIHWFSQALALSHLRRY